MNNDIYFQRLQKVKEEASCRNIDAALITKAENKYYLSGFKSTHYYIVLTEQKDYLLTDFRYLESAKGKSDLFEIVCLTNHYTIFDFINDLHPESLGIEEKNITYDFYRELKGTVSERIVCLETFVEKSRMIKDQFEIQNIKAAAQIADSAFEHITEYIRPEMTEKEIALELEFYMRKQGADSLSFDTIVASGERSSLPHGVASDRVIKNGDLITLDFGCMVNGYCSDMTRTVGVSHIDEEQREIYHIVKKSQAQALVGIKPHKTCTEIDRISRDIIQGYGYGEAFGHGLGHGVGLEIHEAPTLNAASSHILIPDMVVTVEPGIYLSNRFGVRIEDLIVISDYGIMNLTSSTKELLIL